MLGEAPGEPLGVGGIVHPERGPERGRSGKLGEAAAQEPRGRLAVRLGEGGIAQREPPVRAEDGEAVGQDLGRAREHGARPLGLCLGRPHGSLGRLLGGDVAAVAGEANDLSRLVLERHLNSPLTNPGPADSLRP